jgi:sec-independent protein translocase protein TatB
VFNTGPAELIVIVIVLLIAVGPEQLPGVIRSVGRWVSQARSMTEGLRSEFMAGLDEIERTADPRRWEPDELDPLPVTNSASPTIRTGVNGSSSAASTDSSEGDDEPSEAEAVDHAEQAQDSDADVGDRTGELPEGSESAQPDQSVTSDQEPRS